MNREQTPNECPARSYTRAQETKKSKPDPLVIQEQGSFGVGGTVFTAPGTFDPIKQGAFNPAGIDFIARHVHVDHLFPVIDLDA